MSITAEAGRTGVPEEYDHPLLGVRGLSKSFGAVHALSDVDLDIPNGQITALSLIHISEPTRPY